MLEAFNSPKDWDESPRNDFDPRHPPKLPTFEPYPPTAMQLLLDDLFKATPPKTKKPPQLSPNDFAIPEDEQQIEFMRNEVRRFTPRDPITDSYAPRKFLYND